MLGSGIADPGIGEIAEQGDVPYLAVHPLQTFTPNSGVTGPDFLWDAFYVPKIQSIIDGTWEPTFDFFGAKEGAIDVGPFGKAFTDSVTQEQMEQYEEIAQALKSGEFQVLPGTTKELTTLEYVVPGVNGVDVETREISPPSS
jgi:simple sugar transport system substrate-binding protein